MRDVKEIQNDFSTEFLTASLTKCTEPFRGYGMEQGQKFDNDKLRYDLIPFDSLEELVKVYTYGAKKYEDNNWRKGIQFSRIIGAILRHLSAFIRGRNNDRESGLPHLAHAAWGCFTLLNYCRTHPELDDRNHEPQQVVES